jgi:circadian clock protein KaiC
MLRFFEALGEVKKALSVIKKRTGKHENTLREFGVVKNKLHVGQPLKQFRGVLTGVPEFVGGSLKTTRSP